MVIAFQAVAAVFGLFGALEGIRAVALWRAADDDAGPVGYAATIWLSIGLLFLVMARVDG